MGKFKSFILILCSLSLFSCGDDEGYDFPGNGGKVYVLVQPSNMVSSTANLGESSLSVNSMGAFGSAIVKFPVKTTMPVQGTMEVEIGVNNQLIDSYNQLHGTDYLPLSADVLHFNRNVLHVGDQQMESADSLDVFVDINKIKSLKVGEYLVPLQILRSSSMEVSENMNTFYWVINIKNDATGIPVADRTGWSILEFSSEDPYEENLAVNVLDGDLGTIWHTEWYAAQPEPPHFISIDMGKEVNMAGFQYVTRNRNTGVPSQLTLAVSLDGDKWIDVQTYDNLPKGASVEFRTLFDQPCKARYFRLYITEIYSNEDFVSLAEINAFIVNE